MHSPLADRPTRYIIVSSTTSSTITSATTTATQTWSRLDSFSPFPPRIADFAGAETFDSTIVVVVEQAVYGDIARRRRRRGRPPAPVSSKTAIERLFSAAHLFHRFALPHPSHNSILHLFTISLLQWIPCNTMYDYAAPATTIAQIGRGGLSRCHSSHHQVGTILWSAW
jgi:hypothetical protein